MNDRERQLVAASIGRAERLARWYDRQSARLGLSRDELTAAVLRGWTGDVIAALPATDAHLLAGNPC